MHPSFEGTDLCKLVFLPHLTLSMLRTRYVTFKLTFLSELYGLLRAEWYEPILSSLDS